MGYGEIIPRSVLGRLFTVPLLVFGLLLIALPSFVLGRNFAIVFDAMQHQLNVPVSLPCRDSSSEYSSELNMTTRTRSRPQVSVAHSIERQVLCQDPAPCPRLTVPKRPRHRHPVRSGWRTEA